VIELFGELEFVVMLKDDQGVGSEEIGGGEKFEGAGVVDVGSIGGIDEYEVETRSGGSAARGELLEGGMGVGGEDGEAGRDFEGVEILADQFCGGGVILYEGYLGGAAAKGFDADGAGAGEQIEKAGAYDAGTEDVEERFAQAITCGTEGEAFEAFQDTAAVFAGDDAHEEKN
jgi:hypothetical protein